MHKNLLLFPELAKFISDLHFTSMSASRKEILSPLVTYLRENKSRKEQTNLNFICTHNSRRSQFAQIWAHTAAAYYNFEINCYSGGVEVTEFNQRAVQSLKRSGFQISSKGASNPVYSIHFAKESQPIIAFSKLFDDQANTSKHFAAIMTCGHADENCPFIPRADTRISVLYEDPKEFDGSPLETIKYDERSEQIATEMFYVMSKSAEN